MDFVADRANGGIPWYIALYLVHDRVYRYALEIVRMPCIWIGYPASTDYEPRWSIKHANPPSFSTLQKTYQTTNNQPSKHLWALEINQSPIMSSYSPTTPSQRLSSPDLSVPESPWSQRVIATIRSMDLEHRMIKQSLMTLDYRVRLTPSYSHSSLLRKWSRLTSSPSR